MSDVLERGWTVVNRKGHVVFEGIESDARRFIGDHYPRVHVEPGGAEPTAPDATLRSPEGDSEVHTGPDSFIPLDDFDPGVKPPKKSNEELQAEMDALMAEMNKRKATDAPAPSPEGGESA